MGLHWLSLQHLLLCCLLVTSGSNASIYWTLDNGHAEYVPLASPREESPRRPKLHLLTRAGTLPSRRDYLQGPFQGIAKKGGRVMGYHDNGQIWDDSMVGTIMSMAWLEPRFGKNCRNNEDGVGSTLLMMRAGLWPVDAVNKVAKCQQAAMQDMGPSGRDGIKEETMTLCRSKLSFFFCSGKQASVATIFIIPGDDGWKNAVTRWLCAVFYAAELPVRGMAKAC